ncbi:hypothetical protein QO002_005184 [Pararhizobium capsulatum DSM 1112]|uniref:Uncharacterized protein n=1 Tax=Pararhizobium capsulatum DSM 1112 TaxID=1121113 RepID=A0ABU0BXI7_9HYPH|nr:hypothetical protein [Pararhizobium capsulatum]MDQ0322978.1 hypothetical protein [Pararhizobium capsulatum DSM 1112]
MVQGSCLCVSGAAAPSMTSTTDFIAELFRAGNEVAKLSHSKRKRLLERALTTVKDMRDILGIPSSGTDADQLVQLATFVAKLEHQGDSEVGQAFLTASTLIRDLRIAMDEKVEVMIKELRLPEEAK